MQLLGHKKLYYTLSTFCSRVRFLGTCWGLVGVIYSRTRMNYLYSIHTLNDVLTDDAPEGSIIGYRIVVFRRLRTHLQYLSAFTIVGKYYFLGLRLTLINVKVK